MSTQFLWIHAMQDPYDGGLDDQSRSIHFFNVMAFKKKSGTFARELVAILSAAGVGVPGTSLFFSSSTALPHSGQFLLIRESGGQEGVRTHNVSGVNYQRPMAQIRAYSPTADASLALAHAAYTALEAVRNQDVTPYSGS